MSLHNATRPPWPIRRNHPTRFQRYVPYFRHNGGFMACPGKKERPKK